VPYLDYGPISFFGSALEHLFARYPLRRQVMHENSMCIGLQALALDGHGVCWLPYSLVSNDIDEGRLIVASDDPKWALDLDIRLYRCRSSNSHTGFPEQLWQQLTNLSSEVRTLKTPIKNSED
jgi:DNA-binding transcriptional LysR family regulator